MLLAIVAHGCASSQDAVAVTPSSTRPIRSRPTERTMRRALERWAPDVLRCLHSGASSVTVTGYFEGTSGEYKVTHIAGRESIPYAVETCIRVSVERARVRPFRDERATFGYTFTLPGGTFTGVSSVSSPPASFPSPSPSASRPSVSNHATVTGSLTIRGELSPVDRIRREADALQHCYEQACERDHTVSGTVELHLYLDASGHVTHLSSQVSTPHEDVTLMELVARCIESHVRLIEFGPQAQPGTEIVVPLTFHPGGSGQ